MTAFILGFYAAFAWLMICNVRTCRQRTRIIDCIFQGDDWREKMSSYQTVTYERHMFSLFILRDPFPYYGDAINRQLSGISL